MHPHFRLLPIILKGMIVCGYCAQSFNPFIPVFANWTTQFLSLDLSIVENRGISKKNENRTANSVDPMR